MPAIAMERRAEDEATTEDEHARELADGRPVVGEVLQEVVGVDRCDGGGSEGQARDGRAEREGAGAAKLRARGSADVHEHRPVEREAWSQTGTDLHGRGPRGSGAHPGHRKHRPRAPAALVEGAVVALERTRRTAHGRSTLEWKRSRRRYPVRVTSLASC